MTGSKRAGIIIIGDEILSGRTQDSNVQTIATMLAPKGIAVMEVRIIPDAIETIVATVNEMRARMDYVFTTGGIGPTHDDKTAEAIALAFGTALERHPEAWRILSAHYGGDSHINDARAKMADIPAGARLIHNPVSSAPGFTIGNVFVMAGVPKIMQGMLEFVMPMLEGGAVIHARSVTADLPESLLAAGLLLIEKAYPGVSVGSYPKFTPGMKPSTAIVLRGHDLAQVETAQKDVASLMEQHGGVVRL